MFYENIPLKWGKRLENSDEKDKFLSNENTEDPNQIGQIGLFFNDVILEIRPLSAMENHILGTDYLLQTDDNSKSKAFAETIERDSPLEAVANDSGNMAVMDINISIFLGKIVLLFCLYVLIIIAFLYYIVFRYKEFGIRKMFGDRNRDLIHRILGQECMPIISKSIIISFVVSFVYLCFYNRLSRFGIFLIVWIVAQLILIAILLISFWILSQSVRSTKISLAIKDKKPVKFIKFLNYITKVLFATVAVMMFAIALQNLGTLIKQNSNFKKWEETKDYAVLGFTADDSTETDFVKGYLLSGKLHEFWKMMNNQGAMLMSPGSYYTTPFRSDYERDPDYEKYRVDINNNYLKLNPIYDLNGEKVDVTDEETTNMTLLVPEKYREFEEQIYNYCSRRHTFLYNYGAVRYAKEMGEDVPYDPGIEDELLKHHELMMPNIIYVKNDQSYFTYDPNIAKDWNNEIHDPIAWVINNSNMGAAGFLSGTIYSTSISNGTFRPKIEDYEDPMKSLEDAIIESDLQHNIVFVQSLYSTVDKYIYDTRNLILLELSMMILAFIIIVIIIMFTTLNYLEENKLLNSVKRIHGFSFVKRHFMYLLHPIIFWSIIFLLLVGFDVTTKYGVGWVAGIVFVMFAVEFILSIILLRIKEFEKQINVLKGA